MAVGTEETMRKPSRRVIALAVLVVAVICTTLIVKGDNETTPVEIVSQETPERVVVAEKDTDGDGLKDWEEELYGTDPKKTDSNGDGVDDLTEIQNKKDAEQKLREETANTTANSFFSFYGNNEGLTQTDILSRALFEQVIAFKNAGVPLTQEDATQLASTLGGAIVETPDITGDPISLSSIPVITGATTDQIHAYGNAVAGALKVQTSEQNNEFFALVEFMETGNVSALEKLAPVVEHYNDVVAKLLLVATPREIAEGHLNLIRKLQTTAIILERLRNLSADPVTVLPVIQTYQENYTQTVSALHTIKLYLDTKGISYNDSEDGFLLVSAY